MQYQAEIVRLINLFIKRNIELKQRYEENTDNKGLYEELIGLLEVVNHQTIDDNSKIRISTLLHNIYKNGIYSSYYLGLLDKPTEQSKEEFKSFVDSIKKDYTNLVAEIDGQQKRMERSKNLIAAANRVRFAIRKKRAIIDDKNDIISIKEILRYFAIEGEISKKEELLFINEIEHYNIISSRKEKTDEGRKQLDERYHRIQNMLNAGYEVYPKIKVEHNRRKTIDDFVKQILGFIDSLEDGNIIDAIEKYRKYHVTDEEYKYIIIEILNYYIKEMIEYYNFILDAELYVSGENMEDAIKEYYTRLNKFLIVRKYYDDITEDIITTREEESNIDEINQENILVYSCSKVGEIKPRIISDMKSIPYEYYGSVLDLINRFKYGQIKKGEIKSLSNNKSLTGVIELKNDQIRIVMRNIRENIYVIHGVFVKKDDNAETMYTSMANREIPDINTDDKYDAELSTAAVTEEELRKLVSAKGRKGTR